jgi:hypothetical protein
MAPGLPPISMVNNPTPSAQNGGEREALPVVSVEPKRPEQGTDGFPVENFVILSEGETRTGKPV